VWIDTIQKKKKSTASVYCTTRQVPDGLIAVNWACTRCSTEGKEEENKIDPGLIGRHTHQGRWKGRRGKKKERKKENDAQDYGLLE